MKVKFEIRHYMIAFLSILAFIGMFKHGFQNVFLHLLVGVLSTVIVDVAINYFKFKRFILSPSGIITGLIVAEVLSFDLSNHLVIVAIASLIAIIGKHLIVYEKRHVFNPAGLGIIITSLFFSSALSWWGITNIWLIIIFGLIILYKLRKYELTASYLIVHSIIIAIIAIAKSESVISYLQLTNPYFVAFMMIEPITSPMKRRARIVYGSLIAIISILFLYLIPSIDHSIAGLLIANVMGRFLDKRLG